MLHITNGSSVSLADSGVGGEVLVWADPLHEGPVPEDLPLSELTDLRADFLAASSSRLDCGQVRRDLRTRNQRLEHWRDHREVVLWFEHDLFDQLLLLQLLDYFASQRDAPGRIELIQVSTYLGPMTPEQLASLYPHRRPVSAEQFRFGAFAWAAFRSPDPSRLAPLARMSELPYVAPALQRHLEEFPSTANGLGRTDRRILEIAAGGPAGIREGFLEFQRGEDPIYLGDTSFYAHARALASRPMPLIRYEDDTIAATGEGIDVLEGRADDVRLNGIDRWLGGVHLTPGNIWRFDLSTAALSKETY